MAFERLYEIEECGYSTACWVWRAALGKDGYGRYQPPGHKTVLAHRWAFLQRHGNLPVYPEHELDHLCQNPACVNPDHLEAVTASENQRRGFWGSRTQCVNGHPYDEENTYLRPNGRRDCRACIRERQRQYQSRRIAA